MDGAADLIQFANARWVRMVAWGLLLIVPAALLHLAGCGVETRPVFYPAHTMPMYATPFQRLPVAEDLGWRGINLPSWPGLADAQVDLVCDEILRFLKPARP